MFGKFTTTITFFVGCVIVMSTFASASATSIVCANDLTTSDNMGYILSPTIIYDTITQGQTNWCSKSVSSFITTLNVDLYWGNSANSLELTIYAPDANVYGPYYDSDDGSIDGRINLGLYDSNGVPQGTWYYKVYGYSVSGTQSYSI